MFSTITQLAQSVLPHKPALVDISPDAVDMSLSGVLPQQIIFVVGKDRLFRGVLGYHELVVVEFANEIAVVEVCACVDKRFLMIGLLHHVEKLEQRVAESLIAHALLGLHVNHWDKILLARTTLSFEILKL